MTTQLRTLPLGAPIPPPARSRAVSRTFLANVLLTVTAVIGWSLLYVLVLSRLDEAHSQRALYAQLRTELAQGLTPISAPIASGAPVALIDAPSAGLHKTVIVEGTDAQNLQRGPGHLRSTVLPGQPGTAAIFGRALSFGAPFGRLHALHAGDTITVTTGQGTFHFRVVDLRHTGDPIPPLANGASRLELLTASGSGPLAALSAGDVLYVDADLVGDPAPATSSALPAASQDERAMAVGTAALTLAELVLSLQLVIAIVVGIGLARARWNSNALWVVAVPVVLASVWLTSVIAARMLPNLM
jgi:sortase A